MRELIVRALPPAYGSLFAKEIKTVKRLYFVTALFESELLPSHKHAGIAPNFKDNGVSIKT
jgi:hypothetical protein